MNNLNTRFEPFNLKIEEDLKKRVCHIAGQTFATVSEMHLVSLLLDGRLQKEAKKTKIEAACKKVLQHGKTFSVDIMALIHPAIKSESGSVTLHM